MQNFCIGISGINAAQKAIDIIGNNIANAATEGYHRQRVELAPAYMTQIGSLLLGGGVNLSDVKRMIDNLLEREILNRQSSLSQVAQECTALRTVESAFGELGTDGGLSTVIDHFFNALQDLTAHPTEIVWQSQAVTVADTLAGQFRTLADFLLDLEDQVTLEAQTIIERINTLTSQIADLNNNIERMEVGGTRTNNLRDQRDQCIAKLAELVGIETIVRDHGVVDVSVAGIPIVAGAFGAELEVGFDESGEMGISLKDAYCYVTDVQGGKLGGLISLQNDLLSDIHDDLDNLASTLIQKVNQYHVQGVGADGSFTQLTGWIMPSEDLADFDPPVTDGKFYIRRTDTSTGQITRHEINVNASTDTLTTIAAAISAINGLSASSGGSKLSITADAGYEFDFLPAVLPLPTASTLTGGSPPSISVSGIYNGTANDTFVFTVSGAGGAVGNGNLQLEVRDNGGAGSVIATLNIGDGYAAGDLLDLGNGIKISVGTGDFGAGDNFEVDVFASSDTAGFLAAAGLNTFFSGSSARDIAVRSDISSSPGRIATALGADLTDNANAVRLAGLKDENLSALNAMTPGEFYRRMVTDLGQDLSIRQMRRDNIQVIVQNLANHRSELSGVNINDEAAQMLIFEQMFQAMAKYLNTVHSSLQSIMEIL